MNIKEAQENIKKGTQPVNMDVNTLRYLQKPLGKTLYVNGNKKQPRDLVKCDVCGKIFTRWNRTKHNKTKHHQLYNNVNEKMRKLILNTD